MLHPKGSYVVFRAIIWIMLVATTTTSSAAAAQPMLRAEGVEVLVCLAVQTLFNALCACILGVGMRSIVGSTLLVFTQAVNVVMVVLIPVLMTADMFSDGVLLACIITAVTCGACYSIILMAGADTLFCGPKNAYNEGIGMRTMYAPAFTDESDPLMRPTPGGVGEDEHLSDRLDGPVGYSIFD